MAILDMVIPILVHFCVFTVKIFISSQIVVLQGYGIQRNVTMNDVKLFLTVYHRSYCHKFLVLSD